jgi:hypothetical protein
MDYTLFVATHHRKCAGETMTAETEQRYYESADLWPWIHRALLSVRTIRDRGNALWSHFFQLLAHDYSDLRTRRVP